MSTENAVTLKLKQMDKEVAAQERKLPLFQRLWRRYATGRMFVATQLIFEPYGFLKGIAVAKGITGTPILTLLAYEFPKAAELLGLLVKAIAAMWANLTH